MIKIKDRQENYGFEPASDFFHDKKREKGLHFEKISQRAFNLQHRSKRKVNNCFVKIV